MGECNPGYPGKPTVVLASLGVASAGAGQSVSSASLARYVVRAGEETGYSPGGAPTFTRSAASWAKGNPNAAADAKRLRGEGFRAAPRPNRATADTTREGLRRTRCRVPEPISDRVHRAVLNRPDRRRGSLDRGCQLTVGPPMLRADSGCPLSADPGDPFAPGGAR